MKKSTLNKLSPGLRKLIIPDDTKLSGTLSKNVKNSSKPVSQFAQSTLLHCNGGSTMQAALWLKNHLDNGGKLVITLAGALSSFQVGVMLAELIRKDKVHLVSATAANHMPKHHCFSVSIQCDGRSACAFPNYKYNSINIFRSVSMDSKQWRPTDCCGGFQKRSLARQKCKFNNQCALG